MTSSTCTGLRSAGARGAARRSSRIPRTNTRCRRLRDAVLSAVPQDSPGPMEFVPCRSPNAAQALQAETVCIAGVPGRASEGVAGLLQIRQDPVENVLPAVRCRQQSLHVLHQKYRRAVPRDDAEVLAVEKMAVVALEFRIGTAPHPRAAHQRVGLARRAANQGPDASRR